MAEEYTYRFLAAARQVLTDDEGLLSRLTPLAMPRPKTHARPVAPDLEVSAAEVRAWAALAGIPISAKGRISADVLEKYREAQP
ncbi:MAG: histone-like nucleoid-structuring protein Lsr2 [Candidatus Nanopelagicales bacterium]